MRRRMILDDTIQTNLHNEETDIKDMWLENGIEKPYKGWSCTDRIPVEEGYYLIKSTRIDINRMQHNYIYGDSEKIIGIFNVSSKINRSFSVLKINKGEKYIRFSSETNILQGLEIYRVEKS